MITDELKIYNRIMRRVEYRLSNNLIKNFGIIYRDTDELLCGLWNDGIDFNFTQAAFKFYDKTYFLDIFDEETDNRLDGESMLAYRFEKLLFNYWGINSETYCCLPTDDKRQHLPPELRYNWEEFKELYSKTFPKPICKYNIVCSSGITRIE